MLAEDKQAASKEQLLDVLSQSSNAYVPKHGGIKQKRMQSASSSKAGSRFSRGTKTYYPDEYSKRVGYELSTTSSQKHRVDALGQRVRERFNEELSYTDNIKTRGLDKKHLVGFDTEKKGMKQTPSQQAMSTISKSETMSKVANSVIR